MPRFRRPRRWLAVLAAPCLLALLPACAATPPDEEVLAAWRAMPQLEPASATEGDLLRDFTGPDGDPDTYKLAPGDRIFVDVFSHTDLTGTHVIGPDGRITITPIGTLKLSGLSREEAAQIVAESLANAYPSPTVVVRVEEYNSAFVSVLGGVTTPGTYTHTQAPSLLRAISAAGGLATLFEGDKPTRCTVVRDDEQIVFIDLRELLWQGNLALDVSLAPQDVVYVHDSSDARCYVLGEVINDGVFRITPDMTYRDAVALAGGFGQDADLEETVVVRPSEGLELVVDFEQLLAGRYDLDVPLRDGDIIWVPRRGIAEFGYVLRNLSPFSTAITVSTRE